MVGPGRAGAAGGHDASPLAGNQEQQQVAMTSHLGQRDSAGATRVKEIMAEELGPSLRGDGDHDQDDEDTLSRR
jgi:hypothetical protein